MSKRRPPKAVSPSATVSGATLWSALGYRNARAFQRAKAAGQIDLPLYPIPEQSRGWFARADELAAYCVRCQGDGRLPARQEAPVSGEDAPGKGGAP